MDQQKFTFIKSLGLLFVRLLSRRIHFSKNYVGKILIMDDRKKFQVIRDLMVDSKYGLEMSRTVFIVRFKFSGLPLSVNKRLSMIPALFLMVKPGFRQKIWAVSEDGYFQGLYQWASEANAIQYPHSFIFKLMTKRAAEGTLNFELIPDTVLSHYLEKLIK